MCRRSGGGWGIETLLLHHLLLLLILRRDGISLLLRLLRVARKALLLDKLLLWRHGWPRIALLLLLLLLVRLLWIATISGKWLLLLLIVSLWGLRRGTVKGLLLRRLGSGARVATATTIAAHLLGRHLVHSSSHLIRKSLCRVLLLLWRWLLLLLLLLLSDKRAPERVH